MYKRQGNTTTVRNGATETEKTGDANYVENNIGIYARSGQRGKETINGQVAQIKPSEDLGAKDAARNTNFDLDEVHSLQVNDIDISFGKDVYKRQFLLHSLNHLYLFLKLLLEVNQLL